MSTPEKPKPVAPVTRLKTWPKPLTKTVPPPPDDEKKPVKRGSK